MNIVTATFKDRASSETALRKLENIGIKGEQVSLVMTDETRHNHFKIDEDTKVDEGAISGAAIGGIAGTLLSILTTAGAMAIPGLNLVITGPVVAAFAGLGVGAITGGIVGGLAGAGVPEHEAKVYEREIKSGGVLLAVQATDDLQKKMIKEALKTADAYNIAA
jgi:hypothetical protein